MLKLSSTIISPPKKVLKVVPWGWGRVGLQACVVHPSLLQLSVQLRELQYALSSYLHNSVRSLPMHFKLFRVFPEKSLLQIDALLVNCKFRRGLTYCDAGLVSLKFFLAASFKPYACPSQELWNIIE